MSLQDFMNTHRAELLAACQAELDAGSSTARLGSHFTELLVSMMRAASAYHEPPADHGTALLGQHSAVARLRTAIDQLSRRSRTPVLLLGEFGTGKRRCAHALHEATYPDGELFELKGSDGVHTLERRLTRLRTNTSADATAGLTVYVHALHETSPQVQAFISKLLQEQGLQLRVVASSERALTQACREGQLRSDLVFGFPTTLELPPLRDRASDIAALTVYFAQRHAERSQREPFTLGSGALRKLEQHAWPGNLTELDNLVRRLTDDFAGQAVDEAQLPDLGEPPALARFSLPPSGVDLSELERELLVQALAMTDNNQSRAARLLGLTRDQIRYRLAKFDLLLTAPA